ncbi:hypothetical protein Cgig2_032007 [Carnegiea gigantea]|uniref:Uncharacterized protein n=1 Tax=Carnegiea gigantea TaxID=171969 RepID=A0A9Q1K5B8_9CARY|nr:hypothetical protein Cgig2_032007 [Carnegiea gigantea]
MLVWKPARRKHARQQTQSGGRLGGEPGLNQYMGDRITVHNEQNLVTRLDNESAEDGARLKPQSNRNQGPNMELGGSETHDHGSRSRALAYLDLNIELESVMEGADLQGNKEDYITYKEGEDVDCGRIGDNGSEVRKDMTTAADGVHTRNLEECANSCFMMNFMTTFIDMGSQEIRILVWNTQGAGSRDFLNTLKEHIRMQHPQIMVMLETHISGSIVDLVCNKIGFGGQLRVDVREF